jgi:hypothetical protein
MKVNEEDVIKNPQKYITIGRVSVPRRDLKDIIPQIGDYKHIFSREDYGIKGSFRLVNIKTGQIIKFAEGRRIKEIGETNGTTGNPERRDITS